MSQLSLFDLIINLSSKLELFVAYLSYDNYNIFSVWNSLQIHSLKLVRISVFLSVGTKDKQKYNNLGVKISASRVAKSILFSKRNTMTLHK